MASGNPTAAQKVLTTAELVGEIMFWLAQSQDNEAIPATPAATTTPIASQRTGHVVNGYWFTQTQTIEQNLATPGATPTPVTSPGAPATTPTVIASLAACARVNSLWFCEAIHHLWSRPDGSSDSTAYSLPQIMAGLAKSRRQFYANFITHGSLVDVQKATVRAHNKALRGVTFPKLKYVTLILDHSRPLLSLPNIQLPALKTFRIRLGGIESTDIPAKFKIGYRPCYRRRRQLFTRGMGETFPLVLQERTLSIYMARMVARQVQRRFTGIKIIAFGPELEVNISAVRVFEAALPGIVLRSDHPGYLKKVDADSRSLGPEEATP